MIAAHPHRAGLIWPIAPAAVRPLGGRGASHSRGSRASEVRYGVPDKPFLGVSSRLTGRPARVAGPFGMFFSRDRLVPASRSDRACSAAPIQLPGPH